MAYMKTKLHYLLTSRSFIPPACKVAISNYDVGVSEIFLWALPVPCPMSACSDITWVYKYKKVDLHNGWY